ncbi:MAG: YceI family protein [Deltaproteobacteria bacterium]|jgi:polyisoprenoid-binding protein YceI
MNRTAAFTGTLLIGLVGSAPAFADTWALDTSHSHVGFSVAHLVVTKAKGQFNKFSGTVQIDDKDITKSTVNVEIDAASIDTNDEKRDGHLKSPDFFNVAKHPKLTFVSTKVKKAGKGKLTVLGNLTIAGTTKPVTLTVEGPSKAVKDPWGNTRRALSATTKINREDFGMTWNKALEAGGMVVGKEVTIQIEAELIKK